MIKKIKNLKNSFADNILFIIYMVGIITGGIVFNEMYQIDYQKRLALLTQVKSETTEKVEKEKADVFKVKLIKGEVKLLNPLDKTIIKESLQEGEILPSGSLIKTGLSAFAVFSFGSKNTSHMKVGRSSEVVLTYTNQNNKEKEKSLYNQATEIILNSGNVLLDIKDKYKKDTFKIKTRKAVMGVRGTTFLISYDKELDKMAVAVKEGLIAMINLIDTTLTEIAAGEGFMILKNGFQINLDIGKLLPNFDIFNSKNPIIDEQAVKDIGKEKKTTEKKEDEKQDVPEIDHYAIKLEKLNQRFKILNKDFANYLRNQEGVLARLQRESLAIDRELFQTEAELKKRKILIEKDLLCLNSSAKRCPLENRDLLIKRGFPRIIFNSRTKSSMSDELLKYVQEKEARIKSLQSQLSENEMKSKKIQAKLSHGIKAQVQLKNMNSDSELAGSIRVLKNGTKDAGAKTLYDDVRKIEQELAE